jgi:Brp/Blh family beta-carotene 15,15'-monooxygenase
MLKSNHPFFHQIILLVFVLVFTTLQWFFKFNLATQIGFFLAITLSIGVFHGLLDIILLKQKSFNQPRFLSLYAFIAIVTLVFFAQYSSAALIVLLLLSVWHFGESQRFDDVRKLNHLLKRLVLGASVIAAPFALANSQLQQVLAIILPNDHWLQITWWVWGAITWLWLLAFAIYFIRLTIQKNLTGFYAGLLEISVVWLSFALLAPLVAFSLYFGAYHAIRHIRDVLESKQVLKNKKMALLSTALATACMLGVVVWLFSTKINIFIFSSQILLQAAIILLVAITLPHAILISFWRKNYLHKSL